MASLVIFWGFYPHAYEASDPYVYAYNAYRLSTGQFFGGPEDTPFAHRIGLLAPVAAVYALWDITPRATHVVPLLAVLGVLVSIGLALPDRRSRAFALLVAITNIPLLSATTGLFPDIVAAAFMTASVLVLFHRESLAVRRHGWLYGALGAGLWFYAFLAKETACWALPVWLASCGADAAARRRQLLFRFYVPAAASGLALAALYLCGCKLLYGNAFARFSNIEALADTHAWSITESGRLKRRLLTEPFDFFAEQYGALCVLGLFAPLVLPRKLRFWAYVGAFYVAAFWFGSASLGKYRPLPLFPRMALPCAPPLFIVCGYLIAWLTRRARSRCGVALACGALVILNFAPLFDYARSQRPDPEQIAARRVKHEVMRAPQRRFVLVCSDHRSAQFLSIYFGFEVPTNLSIAYARDLSAEQLAAADSAFFYVNEERSRFMWRKYRRPFYDGALRGLALQTLLDRRGVALFRATAPFSFTPEAWGGR